jgi:hypothetical protein
MEVNMEQKYFNTNRRDFLAKVVPLAAFGCLGCRQSAVNQISSGSKHKFSEKLGLNAEETYSFFYGQFIPVLQKLSDEMGREKFNEIFTSVSTENIGLWIASITKDLPEKNIRAFSSLLLELIGTPPYNSTFTCEVVEQTESVLELKYTECLPAKLLRAMNAIDIGLALECSGASAAAKAFNPKISYSNPQNLMKGDSYCIERFTLNT